MATTIALIVGIAAFFATLWYGVVACIGTFGGWGAMARDYPAPEPPTAGQRIPVTSLGFGRGLVSVGTYWSAVTLLLTPRGFELRTRALFHFLHPGLAVPWRAVRTYEKGKAFGQPFIRVALSQGQHLRICGRAATALVQALARAAARVEV